jgi:hypothetical protein
VVEVMNKGCYEDKEPLSLGEHVLKAGRSGV